MGTAPSGASSAGGGFASVLGGAALLLLAAFAPWALFRLLPFVEAGAVGHLEGLGQRARSRAAAPTKGLAAVALRSSMAGQLGGQVAGAGSLRRGSAWWAARVPVVAFAARALAARAWAADRSPGDGDPDVGTAPGGDRGLAPVARGPDGRRPGPGSVPDRGGGPGCCPATASAAERGARRPTPSASDPLGPRLIAARTFAGPTDPVTADDRRTPAARVRYRFPPLERRGVIAGWRGGQIAVVAGGLLLAVVAVRAAPSVAGVLVAVALVGVAVALAFWPIGGRTGEQWLPLVARWVWSGAAGRRRQLDPGPRRGVPVAVRLLHRYPAAASNLRLLTGFGAGGRDGVRRAPGGGTARRSSRFDRAGGGGGRRTGPGGDRGARRARPQLRPARPRGAGRAGRCLGAGPGLPRP